MAFNPYDPSDKRVHNEFTRDMYGCYFQALESCGRFIAAADACGVSYQDTLEARKTDEVFSQMCEEALERYRGKFLDEAQRRALIGYEEPIVGGHYKDEIVATRTIYSDRLLELFLKRSQDGTFTEKQQVHVTGGFDIKRELDLSSLSTRARRMLRDLLEQITADEANRELGNKVE